MSQVGLFIPKQINITEKADHKKECLSSLSEQFPGKIIQGIQFWSMVMHTWKERCYIPVSEFKESWDPLFQTNPF